MHSHISTCRVKINWIHLNQAPQTEMFLTVILIISVMRQLPCMQGKADSCLLLKRSEKYGIYLLAPWMALECIPNISGGSSLPSPESHFSLKIIGSIYLCARSWSWSKVTYLSGKMSVISFSNQFSRCFSHNSGDFLLDTRTENPFIPCLYLWPLYHQGLNQTTMEL